MKIAVERIQKDSNVTIGSMQINDEWQCWTLEDVVREVKGQPVSAWKVPGQTAIPAGTYKVELTMSARFKRTLPLLINVPGFSGVRIHAGNTIADTEGCILVGNERFASSIGRSQMALAALMTKMGDAVRRGEPIELSVGDP